jgi:DNA-binding MarR family transcriptional regulator
MDLIEQIQRLSSAFDALKKGPVFTHRGTDLYSSEIHLMKTVASHPDENASGVAKILGVTKGAVSQTLSRLEKKGIFDKEYDPSSKNELRIWLTPFGIKTLDAFHRQFACQWREFTEHIEGMPSDERKTISEFLARLDGFLRSIG